MKITIDILKVKLGNVLQRQTDAHRMTDYIDYLVH
jgi:hypothetical protein